ncbi:MAG: family 20 glycosylhydrolase [Fimbriimonas sp.]
MLSTVLFAAYAAPALLPLPQKVEWRSGFFTLGRETVLVNSGGSPGTVARLREAMGRSLPLEKGGASKVVLRKVPGMAPEGYGLSVDAGQIEIRASSDAGLFYGIQTLRQLDQNGRIPLCRIEDAPRFAWRGLLLDDSRHFWGPKFVRKFIDNMAAHKLNTFHWHLTDDGGWRMESRRYPKLTTVGAWRKEQGTEWDYGNLWFPGRGTKEKLYGGFYSQRELRDMVRYAADRNVTIVPEIEMPGHSLAAAAAYPELQCEPAGNVKADYLKATRSQAPTMICPGKDSTLEFCKRILDETMELFPSKFIHIGADEVDKTLWKECRHCQARMKANGLKDEHELQSWFVRQMDAHIASKGRRLVGWDEILEGGLAKGATVMSWRGIQGGIAAAKAGQDVVMSPTSHCYLDYAYETIPTEKVYGYEPIPAELVGAERNRVLGGQGNVWTEWLSSPAEVESMTYPRAVALAETLWTQPERKSWPDFQRRLDAHYGRLDRMGIAFRLGAPTLEPGVLNRAVAKEWTVTQPELPGARLVLGNGTVVRGDRIPAANRDITMAFQMPGGRKGDAVVGRVVNLRPSDAGSVSMRRQRRSWTGRQAPAPGDFAGTSMDSVAKPTLEGVANEAPFALLFSGSLTVEKPGRYTLGLGSDDGSVLYLDGQRILENDGEHGYLERTVTIDLEKGTYPMQITFFDAGGAKRLEFFWTPPGEARRPVFP